MGCSGFVCRSVFGVWILVFGFAVCLYSRFGGFVWLYVCGLCVYVLFYVCCDFGVVLIPEFSLEFGFCFYDVCVCLLFSLSVSCFLCGLVASPGFGGFLGFGLFLLPGGLAGLVCVGFLSGYLLFFLLVYL